MFLFFNACNRCTDYEFDYSYYQKKNFIQWLLQRVEHLTLVVLRGNFSVNEEAKDAIVGGYPETDAHCANLSLILLSLFIPWGQLLSLFLVEDATIATYKDYN